MSQPSPKIIIAAGTGFLGIALTEYFTNYEIIILTRSESKTKGRIKYVHWDAKTTNGNWTNEIEGAVALINMTGKSVNCRYNEKNTAEIFASRLDSTRILGEAIANSKNPPKVWINAASATIYRHAEDRQMDEYTGEIGKGFSVEVCKAWEKIFEEAQTPPTRKVALRIAMVMGKNGGVFPVFKRLAKLGLGGKHGNGNQFVSWIHEKDFCRVIEFCISNENIQGTYNCAAPLPLRDKDFMYLVRKALKIPFGIPQPKWMLKMGTWIMRTEIELVIKSRNVIPRKLMEEGFTFEYSTFEEAVRDLAK